jgi:PKD repeat protein
MANVKLRIHFGGNSPLMQPTPTAGFAFDQIEIKNCQHAQLAFTSNVNATTKTVSFTNTSTGATSYLWDFGDGNTDVTTNPTHTYANNGQFVVKLYGYTECSTDSLIQVVNVTDVGIATNNNMIINCAPNPTTGLLNINFSNVNAKEMTLSVIDITNKTLITEQISVDNTQKSHQINLSHLSKGIYFVKISTLKSTVINKIILH